MLYGGFIGCIRIAGLLSFPKGALVSNAILKVKKFPHFLLSWIKKMNWIYFFILFLSIITTLFVIAYVSNVLGMGVMTDRYMFFIMPLFAAILVSCLYFIIKTIFTVRMVSETKKSILGNSVLVILCTLVLVSNNYFTECNYLYKEVPKQLR